ncbi:IQ motif and SEC7 domain-containing protein 2-like isoform X2 [Pollicipes pollicipes]|uniref:IQ motif and SEC7 domain-containing protein 2-like isoform X2 n=1 Tax=Pollicipes pollicipes TaxID=41117 RepID=UPI001884D895|nr:IQ motif and SEC7 domain-containing protein 2-like isoform X2 [Pollicipes pollicipes]
MDNRDAVIQLQSRRIAELSAELEAVAGERDVLLLELDQLRCQLELHDLSAASPAASTMPPADGPSAASSSLAAGPGRAKADNCIKRSRINARYELSQDLAERQVACLERRYGGRRARHAATTIQRAYRRYALSKKFRAITLSAKTERRLSRRFDVPASWPAPTAAPPPPAPGSGQAAGRAANGLNGSLENDSDLSDREYQSYNYLNDATYLSEYYAPHANGPPPAVAPYQVAEQRLGPSRRGRGPPPEPPHRTSSVACAPRRLQVASSSSESSLASAGPVSTSSPMVRRRSQVPEIVRKRQYRVGLNLFNTKPERGIDYLIGRGFLDEAPHSVARFLITRKGLSKQMIGEYLGDLQSPFSAAVLE